MYDKYFTANSFTLGSKIPKHKAILIIGATAGKTDSTVHLINSSGSTFSVTLSITDSPFIFPVQTYTITAMASGLTAFYLN